MLTGVRWFSNAPAIALSRIARVLRNSDTVSKIRGTKDAAAIHAFLSETPASHAA